jgi:hypothetical protein
MNAYLKDENNSDIIIDKTGYQVMMEWEAPYMKACIDRLSPFGDVLEIGFGFGYSASTIQRYPIRSHTIIEYDKEALKRLREWANHQPYPVNIIDGEWQNTLHILGKFDCIFFDDSPPEAQDTHEGGEFKVHMFMNRILQSHIKDITFMSSYSATSPHPLTIQFYKENNIRWSSIPVEIDKPSNVKYTDPDDNRMHLLLLKLTARS